jgi:hypothetical protein
MKLNIKQLTGASFEVEADTNATVEAVKAKICLLRGIPASQQRLMFERRILNDYENLEVAKVKEGSVIFLVLNLNPATLQQVPHAHN